MAKEGINNDFVKLLVWTVMDGTIIDERKYNPKSNKRRVQFKLSRPEKIEKLISLLGKLKMPYTIKECAKTGVNKLQPYYIRIYGDAARDIFSELENIKTFPDSFLSLPINTKKEILKTILDTDGSKKGRKVYWVSSDKNNARVVKGICDELGETFEYKGERKSGFTSNTNPVYVFSINTLL
jgi:hypothetical protein